MNRLGKADLAQMNRDYFQSLDKEKLVEVAGNLHALAVEQLERLEQNTSNSSGPPSSDNLYNLEAVDKNEKQTRACVTCESKTQDENSKDKNTPIDSLAKGFGKKLPGKQIGASWIWRTTPARSKHNHTPPSRILCSLQCQVRNHIKQQTPHGVLRTRAREIRRVY